MRSGSWTLEFNVIEFLINNAAVYMNRIKVKVIGIKWILSWTGILKDPEITFCDDKI